MAMTVDEVRLPAHIEQGIEWGPVFKTTLLVADSGVETPIQGWNQCRHMGTLAYGMMQKEDIDDTGFMDVKRFFLARRGRARGFLFKDWTDYEMARQLIDTGDGVEDTFVITNTYIDSAANYIRIITRPILSTLQVWVNNVLIPDTDYAFTPSGGLVFDVAPTNGHAIEVACEFDNPVRFDTDSLMFSVVYQNAASIPQFTIVEINDRTV